MQCSEVVYEKSVWNGHGDTLKIVTVSSGGEVTMRPPGLLVGQRGGISGGDFWNSGLDLGVVNCFPS